MVTQIVRPLVVTRIRLQATSPLAAKKVSIDSGDIACGALRKAVDASGLWPWVRAPMAPWWWADRITAPRWWIR
ncbi:MAG: hypothetical protein ACR5LG_13410 [Sodalis sp. (in: enterobacteria)]|uniref:hypothetical protein n=1 Tax=Sodalis sp. (in: enterobacteria) TaxID=1898979 RepID=UPI003F355C19